MKLFLAICWSIVLIGNIIECAAGLTPAWFDVFIPLAVVFCDCWIDWIAERFIRRKPKNKHNDLDW